MGGIQNAAETCKKPGLAKTPVEVGGAEGSCHFLVSGPTSERSGVGIYAAENAVMWEGAFKSPV